MFKKLNPPVAVALFGLCDSIVIEARDNFRDGLQINFTLGKVLTPAPLSRETVKGGKIVTMTEDQPAQFVGSPINGALEMKGDDYAKWDRSLAGVIAFVMAQLPELAVSGDAFPAPVVKAADAVATLAPVA